MNEITERWIGLWQRVLDPFLWRIAWVNPNGFTEGLRVHWSTGVAVIEDCYLDFQDWEPELEVPRYSSTSYCVEHLNTYGDIPFMAP